MTDQRGSAAYRRAMVGRLLEKFVAETAPAGEPVGGAMNQPVGPIAAGGATAPVVGDERAARDGASVTSPARRATSTTWPDAARVAHAWPVQAPHAHARVLRSTPRPRGRAGRRSRCSPPRTCPARTTSVPCARRAAVPVRGLLPRAGRGVGGRRDAKRPRASPRPRSRSSTSRCRRSSPSSRRSPRQLPHRADRLHRGDAAAALARRAASHRRRDSHRRPGALLPGDAGGAGVAATTTAACRVHSSTQHPSEMQEIVARVLGVPRHMVDVECLRMGGGFGGKETQANCFGGGGGARRAEDAAGRCACG